MSTEEFFNLFLEELRGNRNFHYYYKFLEEKRIIYRKSYFIQRLEYMLQYIGSPGNKIWDCGCGFGTSALFLSLNGYSVYGTTTEHYFKEIPGRIRYWSKYGDLRKLTFDYMNLFDQPIEPEAYDRILVQDTLHHLEPPPKALQIFNMFLRQNGKLLVLEENGNNIIQNVKNYLKRGNKRVIEVYDEHLQKNIVIGNENTRSFAVWERELLKSGFQIEEQSKEYIRLFLPFFYSNSNVDKLQNMEKKLWRENSFLREYFYFGINFIAKKIENR